MTDRYAFLRTTKNHAGEIVALIGDIEVIGEDGVKSLLQAFNAHAAPRIRSGVLTLTEAGVKELRKHVEASGKEMPKSMAALDRAVERIQKMKGGGDAKVQQQPTTMSAR